MLLWVVTVAALAPTASQARDNTFDTFRVDGLDTKKVARDASKEFSAMVKRDFPREIAVVVERQNFDDINSEGELTQRTVFLQALVLQIVSSVLNTTDNEAGRNASLVTVLRIGPQTASHFASGEAVLRPNGRTKSDYNNPYLVTPLAELIVPVDFADLDNSVQDAISAVSDALKGQYAELSPRIRQQYYSASNRPLE